MAAQQPPPVPPTPALQAASGPFDSISPDIEHVRTEGDRLLFTGQQPSGGLREWGRMQARTANVGSRILSRNLEALKIYPLRTYLARMIKDNQAVILLSGTGTGKSFILPLACFMSVRRNPGDARAGETAKLKVAISEQTVNQTRQLGLRLEEVEWYGNNPLTTGHCHASHYIRSVPMQAQQLGYTNNSVNEVTHVAILTAYLAERVALRGDYLTHYIIDEVHAITFRTLTGLAHLMMKKRKKLEIPKIVLATATLENVLKDLFMRYLRFYEITVARCELNSRSPFSVHKRNWDTIQTVPVVSALPPGVHGGRGVEGLAVALADEIRTDRQGIHDPNRDLGIMTWKALENLTSVRMSILCDAAIRYYASIRQPNITVLVFCTGASQQKSLKAMLCDLTSFKENHVAIYMNVGTLREDYAADVRGKPKIDVPEEPKKIIDSMSKQFYGAGFGTQRDATTGGPTEFRPSTSVLKIEPTRAVRECIGILHWMDPRDTVALLHSYQAGTFAIHAVYVVMESMKWTMVRGVGADAEGIAVNRDSWNYFINVALEDAWTQHRETRYVSEKVLAARFILRYLLDVKHTNNAHFEKWNEVLFAKNKDLLDEITQMLNMVTAAFREKGLVGGTHALDLETYYNRNIYRPEFTEAVKAPLAELSPEGYFVASAIWMVADGDRWGVLAEPAERKALKEAKHRAAYKTWMPEEEQHLTNEEKRFFVSESMSDFKVGQIEEEPEDGKEKKVYAFQDLHRFATYSRISKYGDDKVCRGHLTTVNSPRMVAVFFNAKNPYTEFVGGDADGPNTIIIGSSNSPGQYPKRALQFDDNTAMVAADDMRVAIHETARKTLDQEKYNVYGRLYEKRDWLLS